MGCTLGHVRCSMGLWNIHVNKDFRFVAWQVPLVESYTTGWLPFNYGQEPFIVEFGAFAFKASRRVHFKLEDIIVVKQFWPLIKRLWVAHPLIYLLIAESTNWNKKIYNKYLLLECKTLALEFVNLFSQTSDQVRLA